MDTGLETEWRTLSLSFCEKRGGKDVVAHYTKDALEPSAKLDKTLNNIVSILFKCWEERCIVKNGYKVNFFFEN